MKAQSTSVSVTMKNDECPPATDIFLDVDEGEKYFQNHIWKNILKQGPFIMFYHVAFAHSI